MRKVVVKEQIQWVLSYIQRGSANIWKENILEDLEVGVLEYTIVREFLADLKKEFEGEGNKTIKVAELKKVNRGTEQQRSLCRSLEEQQKIVSMREDHWQRNSKEK